ncbi:thioredoxin family protein [Lentisphaera profundi]|uniref:Thioredoxin family protein n=1 Tax=Lentisphaera profundi TaxID=1658616 RepID=A0ABY7VRF7_9BACT|nr:thioredoxin fold domain-containing protein [Lentisphaera profundi]WDE96451.1 thioredoxin family protein [Lentisphaera profundi]
MHKLFLGIIFFSWQLFASEALTDGAQAGRWTMDYTAAKKYAKDNKKFLFINFTGSDWCGWCKLMDKSVFSDPTWGEFAKKELSLVYVDFPKASHLVPAKFLTQNDELKKQYQVKGYPTYIVLSPDGQQLLGRLGAERNVTAAGFIDKLKTLLPSANTELPKFELISHQSEVIEDMNLKLREFAKGDGFTKKVVYEDTYNKLVELLKKDPVLFSTLDPDGFVEIMFYRDLSQMKKLIDLVKQSVNAGTPEDSLYRLIDKKAKVDGENLSKVFLYMTFYSNFGQREKAMQQLPDMTLLKQITSLEKAKPWIALLKSINSKSYLELCFALQKKKLPSADKIFLVNSIADHCVSADADFMDQWFENVLAQEDLTIALKSNFDKKLVSLQKSKNFVQRAIDLASSMRVINQLSEVAVDTGISRAALRHWQFEYAYTLIEQKKDKTTASKSRSNAKRTPKYVAFQLLARNAPSPKTLSGLSFAEQELFAFQQAVAELKQGTYSEFSFDRLLSFKDQYPQTIGRFCNEIFDQWARLVNPNRNSFSRTIQARGQTFRTEPKNIPLTRLRQKKNLQNCQAMFRKVYEAGIQTDPSSQVRAFIACFSQAEVISEDDVRLVFGDLKQLNDEILLVLTKHLMALVQRDWVDDKNRRRIQTQYQTNRSEEEAQKEALSAYQAVINLLTDRLRISDDNIELTVNLASALYDFAEYKNNNKLCTLEEYVALRNQAFTRFRDCAKLYESLLESRKAEYTISPFSNWFSVILGASNLPSLEMSATVSDVYLDDLREQLYGMDPQWRDRHISMLGEWLTKTWPNLQPHVKLPFMSAAKRIMGDHSSIKSIEDQLSLYEDLLSEVKLSAKLDGSSSVGHVNEFGVFLSLQHSKELNREAGGFDKYAMGAVNINGRRVINYRQKFTDQINKALKDKFDLGSITWITDRPKPMGLARKHWQETPLAYLSLRAKDAAIDKLPEIIIEMDFNDGQGQVVLPVRSNVVLISSQSKEYQIRPYKNAKLEMVLDSRGASDGKVSLDLQMTGEGLLPDLSKLLKVPASYKLKLKDEQAEPIVSKFEQKHGGVLVSSELSIEVPVEWQGELASFEFPTLEVKDVLVEYKKYQDADIVPADKVEYLKAKAARSPVFYIMTTLCALLIGLALVKLFKASSIEAPEVRQLDFDLPKNISAVSVSAYLKQIQKSSHELAKDPELEHDINLIDESYFAKTSTQLEPQLETLLKKWEARL